MSFMDEFARITEVLQLGDREFRISFADGSVALLDLTQYIGKGSAFANLADPDYAARVEIADEGRVLRWPGELDFCADLIHDSLANSDSAQPLSNSKPA